MSSSTKLQKNLLKQKIIEIDSRDEVDEHKAKVIRDEMIVHNANSYCPIPMKENDEVLDETQFNTTSTPIIATNRIEKPYITKASKKELGNFGGSLVHGLNFRMLNEPKSVIRKIRFHFVLE